MLAFLSIACSLGPINRQTKWPAITRHVQRKSVLIYVYEDHLTLVRMSRVHVPLGSISKLMRLVQKAKLNAIKRLRKVFIIKLSDSLTNQIKLKTLKRIMAISSPDDVRYVSMDTPFLHSNEIFNKQKTIAVAIDPIQKFIYFLTYLSKGDECRSCLPIIARVNLDGSGYKTIISSGIGHSEGLALDYHNQGGFKLVFNVVLWLATALVQS